MKNFSALIAALGLIVASVPVLATSASADTIIIHHGGHCHMQKVVTFGPHHSKTVTMRKICN